MKHLFLSTLIGIAMALLSAQANAQSPQGCDPHPQNLHCAMWSDPQEKIYYDAYAYDLRNQQAQGVAIQDFNHEQAAWNGVAAMNGAALYGRQDAWAYRGR